MVIDRALKDHSAELARNILARGIVNITTMLNNIYNTSDFVYVACPDFSISLRQRRLILGLPIGGYVNMSKYNFFPLELDVNSCGVHLIELGKEFDVNQFRFDLLTLKNDMNAKKIILDNIPLKWNFSRRNHFINIYKDDSNIYYAVFHSSSETVLFDWEDLHKRFDVKHIHIEGREVPYIIEDDVVEYWRIAEEENKFFFKRHIEVFDLLFHKKYKIIFADQHFGMISKGEILMGCSKIPVNTTFPILTRPFENIFLANANPPSAEINNLFNGKYTLVPHGLGMTVPDSIASIDPDLIKNDYVVVAHTNGSKMVTDTLENIGIGYRDLSVLEEMQRLGEFKIIKKLFPVFCLKM